MPAGVAVGGVAAEVGRPVALDEVVVGEVGVAVVDGVLLPAGRVPEHRVVHVVVGDDVAAAGGVEGDGLVVLHRDVVLHQAGRGARADHQPVGLAAGILVRRAVGVGVADDAAVAPPDADVVAVLPGVLGVEGAPPLAVGLDVLRPAVGHVAEGHRAAGEAPLVVAAGDGDVLDARPAVAQRAGGGVDRDGAPDLRAAGQREVDVQRVLEGEGGPADGGDLVGLHRGAPVGHHVLGRAVRRWRGRRR